MSRIDEALRQAGLKTADPYPAQSPAALESFPVGPDEVSEPAHLHVPAPEPVSLRSEPAAHPSPSSARSATAAPSSPTLPTGSSSPLSAGRSEPTRPGSTARFSASEKLVIHPTAGYGCVEQYRRVAAMLHQLQEERGTKVLMVASAAMSEGKTLTAANLALTLSESYHRRVLLIDADLRRPSLTALFGVRSGSGLSESLRTANRGPLRVLELSDRLALLPGGRPDTDPMAGLTSGRMQQIIAEAAANYDWVILDTPPVSLQPDAHLLSAFIEAAVFVIGAGISPAAVVQNAIETIGREKIVGVVLNRVDAAAFNESAYYDYYYDESRGSGSKAPAAVRT